MLTQEQNDRLTKVGPGTPMGELMRRYWHPILAGSELNDENPTKEVRLLGEDLTLFRSASGVVGLIQQRCPHRNANLSYGIPEPEGIRCAYHGWVFDQAGNCLEQPSEPLGSRFKDKVKIKAYPAEELGGLIFAYLGPSPGRCYPVTRSSSGQASGPLGRLPFHVIGSNVTRIPWTPCTFSGSIAIGAAGK